MTADYDTLVLPPPRGPEKPTPIVWGTHRPGTVLEACMRMRVRMRGPNVETVPALVWRMKPMLKEVLLLLRRRNPVGAGEEGKALRLNPCAVAKVEEPRADNP